MVQDYAEGVQDFATVFARSFLGVRLQRGLIVFIGHD